MYSYPYFFPQVGGASYVSAWPVNEISPEENDCLLHTEYVVIVHI